MAVRRDRPGPPAGKDFDPEHYYNLWRYVTRFIRYSDLGQALVVTGGASGTSTTGTLTLAVSGSGSGGGGFGTIAGAGDLNGTSTTGTLTSFLSTLAGTFFQVGAVPNLLNFNGTDANGIQMQLWGSHTNGVNFLMRGTGATPRKYFRVVGAGVLEVVNNAYSQTLLSVNDAGTTTAVAFGAGFSQWGTESAGFVSGGTGTFAALWVGTSTGGFSRWGTSSQTLVQGASASFTGTGTYGGVLSTRALSGAVGSSATRANAVIGPYVNGVPVSITTVAGTLMGYGIPAGAITGSGQGVEFSMWGTAQLSPSNGGLIVKLGTATLINGTSTIAPSAWVIEGQITGQASAQQQFFTRFAVFTNNGVGIEQVNVGTLGMNLSTVTTLCLAGTGTNSNVRQQNGMTVKFMGLQ